MSECEQDGVRVGGAATSSVTFLCPSFEEDIHIAGLPTFHLDVTNFLGRRTSIRPDG